MASWNNVAGGGVFKKNKTTYRQILKSDWVGDLCMEAAMSLDEDGAKHIPRNDGNRTKVHVHASARLLLNHRPHFI